MKARTPQPLLLALLLVYAPRPGHADEPADAWNGLWNECYDVHTIGFDERMDSFKKLISLGKAWQSDVESDKAAIDAVTDKTCKAWAASPNGDTYLKEFLDKYGAASGLALSLEDEASNYLLANLEKWNQLQSEEVKTLESFPSGAHDLRWETHFPCSGAFSRAVTHIRAETQAIEQKLDRLRKQCPHAADSAIRASAAERARRSGGPDSASAPSGLMPKGNPSGSQSDITGTDKKDRSL